MTLTVAPTLSALDAPLVGGAASRLPGADTTLLKCLATLLIVNSHCEALWPRSWMAADGLIGGELFFAIAGFGLVLSERAKRRPFLPWYWRRAVRIYPALWITVALVPLLLRGGWRSWGSHEYVRHLIWPTDYGFVAHVMPFYVIFFLLMRVRRSWVLPAAFALVTALYGVAYVTDLRTLDAGTHLSLGTRPLMIALAACFQMMLLGAWRAGRADGSVRPARPATLVLLALAFAAYVGAKYEMVVGGHFARGYPLLHLLALAIAYCLFAVTQSRPALEFVRRAGVIPWIVRLLGALTLEIYLVHLFIVENAHLHVSPAAASPRVPFPANLLVMLIVSIAWAAALAWVVRGTLRTIGRSGPNRA